MPMPRTMITTATQGTTTAIMSVMSTTLPLTNTHVDLLFNRQCKTVFTLPVRVALRGERNRNTIGVSNAAFHWARKLVFPNSYCRVGSRGARIPEFPTWKYDFRLQWNDISYWETRK